MAKRCLNLTSIVWGTQHNLMPNYLYSKEAFNNRLCELYLRTLPGSDIRGIVSRAKKKKMSVPQFLVKYMEQDLKSVKAWHVVLIDRHILWPKECRQMLEEDSRIYDAGLVDWNYEHPQHKGSFVVRFIRPVVVGMKTVPEELEDRLNVMRQGNDELFMSKGFEPTAHFFKAVLDVGDLISINVTKEDFEGPNRAEQFDQYMVETMLEALEAVWYSNIREELIKSLQ